MGETLRLMVVAAHPDDETLGLGAVLARYASEGVETYLITATRGERGRYLDHRSGAPGHPGARALAEIRERELRRAKVELVPRRDRGVNGDSVFVHGCPQPHEQTF